ncbi:hypothetical protein FA13DRAFT_1277736 [Coprinellus micaceus]|uniref:Uncharacterized protein n=1 Tax=Coprinellus micaceus TaxID=71717 RepID=A0A4Y7R8V9_COPMI|nr:hypothetical protein FA13DRAFT_1277736 [Coprinellus micaceus]
MITRPCETVPSASYLSDIGWPSSSHALECSISSYVGAIKRRGTNVSLQVMFFTALVLLCLYLISQLYSVSFRTRDSAAPLNLCGEEIPSTTPYAVKRIGAYLGRRE